MVSLRNEQFRLASVVRCAKPIQSRRIGESVESRRSSQATACNKRCVMNAGDPIGSKGRVRLAEPPETGMLPEGHWLKVNRHKRLPVLLKTLKRKVRGYYNYFRVVGNSRGLWTFYKEVVKLLYKWLNRRSQRRSLTWPKLKRVLERFAFPTPAQPSRQTVNRGLA